MAGLALLLSVLLNEYAVRVRGGQMSDAASYPVGFAALLAFFAALVGIRAYIDVERTRVSGAALLALFAGLAALGAGLFIFFSPTYFNLGIQCIDPGGMDCPAGTAIREEDFALFYRSALAAAAGAVLALASATFLTRGRSASARGNTGPPATDRGSRSA